MKRLAALSVLIFLPSGLAAAQSLPDSFAPGPVIEAFGPSASVDADLALPAATELNVVFDISSAAEDGKVSREFETVARFLNMHVRAGLPREQVQPAIVVHGPAAQYLLQPGPTVDPDETTRLVIALLEAGVPIYLCGQTAAAKDISKDELLPGVTLALSAMTAHALLLQDGYTPNPF